MLSTITVRRMFSLLPFVLGAASVCEGADTKTRAEAVCYAPGGGYVYCDYGMDMTKKNLTGAADTSSENKWAGYREIYLGGTWATGSGEYAEGAAYNYDGVLIDKFTFELRDTSNANSPVTCEADLYIGGGTTKYCTFEISEFCDELLFPMQDWEEPVLDAERLALFIGFGEDFVKNAHSMLAGLKKGTGTQPGCNCGSGYQFMPNSDMIKELVTALVDLSASGLPEGFSREEFEGMVAVLLEEYEFALAEESGAVATSQTQSENGGADIIRIQKHEALCRIIGLDYATGLPITSCFYGHRVDTTQIKDGEEITNIRILAHEEIYVGGTYADGAYNYDGEFVGKFRKDFKYNDNADIFWKVEVGLCGSDLEFCSMRDMEYGDKSRTHEQCYGIGHPIYGGPPDSPPPGYPVYGGAPDPPPPGYPDCPPWNHYKKKYWGGYKQFQ